MKQRRGDASCGVVISHALMAFEGRQADGRYGARFSPGVDNSDAGRLTLATRPSAPRIAQASGMVDGATRHRCDAMRGRIGAPERVLRIERSPCGAKMV